MGHFVAPSVKSQFVVASVTLGPIVLAGLTLLSLWLSDVISTKTVWIALATLAMFLFIIALTITFLYLIGMRQECNIYRIVKRYV